MPVRNGKKGGGRSASSPARRASRTTATKRKGKAPRKSGRREEALARVREEQARVDAWIASQEVEAAAPARPARRAAVTAGQAVAVAPVEADRPDESIFIDVRFTTVTPEISLMETLPLDGASMRKREEWPMGEARNLVREGYTVRHVMALTGWPEWALEGIRPGRW